MLENSPNAVDFGGSDTLKVDWGKPVGMQLVGYIDAGTGSYLLAAIGGGVAGMWFYIRGKIDRLRGRKPEPQTEEEKEVAVLEEADQQDG